MACTLNAATTNNTEKAAATSFTDTTHTIAAGSNTALEVALIFGGTATGTPVVHWDSTGTNQSMTLIGSATNSTGGLASVFLFGLVNPTPGNKTLSVTVTGSTVTLTVNYLTVNGADQTGGATTFYNFAARAGSTANPSTQTIAATAGDAAVSSCIAGTVATQAGHIGTVWWLNNTATQDDSSGLYIVPATSSNVFTFNNSTANNNVQVGNAIKAAAGGPSPVQIFLTSGTSLAKPGDWTEAGHTVELIGAGGNGGVGTAGSTTWRSGTGGGGGGYSKLTYLSGTTGANFTYAIGAANTSTSSADGTAGTYWENTTNTNSYEARGGLAGLAGGVGTAGGAGGSTITNGTPSPVTYTSTTSNAGGAGGATAAVTAGAGGGGGSGGPNGVGGTGGASVSSGFGGGGGGGANGGATAATTTSANGGVGGNGRGATGGGAAGVTGTPAGGNATAGTGAGGGGGFTSGTGAANTHGGNGAIDTGVGWGANGPGGGGGGGGGNTVNTTGATTSGGNASTFGGGGGGSGGTRSATSTRTAGTGAPGIIVVTYSQGPVTGTWVSTDTTDVMAFAGLTGDFGPLAATDTQDHLAFVGTVLVAGSFAVTDPTDTAAFNGLAGDFGPWSSTGAADVMAFAGLAGVFGSFALTDPTDVAAFSATTASYFVSTSVSDITLGAGPNQYAIIGNPVIGTININLLASGSEVGSVTTIVGDPGTNGTSTGAFQLRLLFSPTNSNITITPTIFIYRSGILIGSEPASPTLNTAFNGGILTWNWTNPALGSWQAGDRLLFQLQVVNSNSGSSQSTNLVLDGVNSLVDVPWTPVVAISGPWSSGDTTDVMAFVGRADLIGTWASTETTDTWASSGTVQWFGTWASTETTDTAAFTGLAGDFGAWASTETTDAMVFSGSVVNVGTWASTDTKDVLSFSGSVSVSGSWASTDLTDTLAYSGTVQWLATWASTDTNDTLAFAGLAGDFGTFVATDNIDHLAYSGTVEWTTSFALTDITDTMSFAGAPASFGPWASTEDTDILSFSSSTQTLGTFNTTDIQDTTFAWLVDDNGNYVVDGSGNRIQIGGFYGIVGSTVTFAMTDGQDQAALNGLVSGNLGPLAATDTQDVMAFAGTVATITIDGTWASNEEDFLQDVSGNLILDVNNDPIGLGGIDTMLFMGAGAGTGPLSATDNTDIASINVSTETDGSFAVTDPTDIANFNATFDIFGDWNSIEDKDHGSDPIYVVDSSGNLIVDQHGTPIVAGYGPVFIGLVGVAVGPWASTDPIDLMDFHGNTGAGPTHSGVQRIELAIKRKIEWIVAKEIVERVYDRDLQWLDNVDFDSMMPTERASFIDTIAQSIEVGYLVDQGMLLTDVYRLVDEIKLERQQQDDEEAITMLLEDA